MFLLKLGIKFMNIYVYVAEDDCLENGKKA